MNFSIDFSTRGSAVAESNDTYSVGLFELDAFRAVWGDVEVEHLFVKGICQSRLEIVLSEQQARQFGELFQHRTRVYVNVRVKGLNSFLRPQYTYNPYTKVVNKIYEIDQGSLLACWVADGCPHTGTSKTCWLPSARYIEIPSALEPIETPKRAMRIQEE